VHGDTALHDSVPNLSRALNNEVACMIFLFGRWVRCPPDGTPRRRAPRQQAGSHS